MHVVDINALPEAEMIVPSFLDAALKQWNRSTWDGFWLRLKMYASGMPCAGHGHRHCWGRYRLIERLYGTNCLCIIERWKCDYCGSRWSEVF